MDTPLGIKGSSYRLIASVKLSEYISVSFCVGFPVSNVPMSGLSPEYGVPTYVPAFLSFEF